MKPEGKRPLRRPRCRWVDNIKMDLGEIIWVVCIGLVWLRIGISGGGEALVKAGSIKCWEVLV
jgi:hypothetical protein